MLCILLLLNYCCLILSEKCVVYPQFSFWIPIALDKICYSRSLKPHKNTSVLRGTVLIFTQRYGLPHILRETIPENSTAIAKAITWRWNSKFFMLKKCHYYAQIPSLLRSIKLFPQFLSLGC